MRRQYEVNVFGLLAVTQALLEPIRAGHGRIVNIGSIGGRINTPFVGPYSSSKAAVRSLSASLRRELRPWDIRVALVEPGALDTPIWRKGEEGAQETIDALPERVRTLYARPLEALVAATRKIAAGASSPDDAAQAVEHALTAERPKDALHRRPPGPRPGRAAQRPPRARLRRAGGAGDEDRVAASRGCRAAPAALYAPACVYAQRGEGERPEARARRLRRAQCRRVLRAGNRGSRWQSNTLRKGAHCRGRATRRDAPSPPDAAVSAARRRPGAGGRRGPAFQSRKAASSSASAWGEIESVVSSPRSSSISRIWRRYIVQPSQPAMCASKRARSAGDSAPSR